MRIELLGWLVSNIDGKNRECPYAELKALIDSYETKLGAVQALLEAYERHQDPDEKVYSAAGIAHRLRKALQLKAFEEMK